MFALGYFYPFYGSGNTLYNDFASYVASQGGTMASPANTSSVFDSFRDAGLLDDTSLLCTCDAGKVDDLYYIVLNNGAVVLVAFEAYVAGDSGTFADQQRTTELVQAFDRDGFLSQTSLFCTCDTGKTSTLYYIA